jgi:hypothetical protein
MSHFAKVEDGTVTQVIVAEQDFVDTQDGEWVQTSYNTRGGKHYDPETQEEDAGTPLRKNYAGIGYVYDSAKNAFYAPQPYASWTLNDDTCFWEAPTPMPADGSLEKIYNWDEDTTAWVEITE